MNKNRDNIHSAWHRFVSLAVITGLPALPVIKGLWQLWHSDRNFDGFLLVPFMCGLIFYRNKDELIQCSTKQVKWILFLLPATLGAMLVASNYGFSRIAGLLLAANLLIASFGFLGYSNYRLLVGPFLFLMLMVPPPQPALDFVTVNLQRLFSMIMEAVLSGFSDSFLERRGFEFWFDGIDYLTVITPECSGIHSLLGFVIVSSFFAVFYRHSIINTILIITAGVATSLVLNLLRIFITMQMRLCGLEKYTEGFWHGFLGIAVFMAGSLTLCKFSKFLKTIGMQNRKEKK